MLFLSERSVRLAIGTAGSAISHWRLIANAMSLPNS